MSSGLVIFFSRRFMRSFVLILPIGLALSFTSGNAPAQREIRDENLDSLSRSFQETTKKLTTPEFERRKQVLRLYQRRGYVEVLSDVKAGDGLTALLSLIKVDAQIEYHLPHDPLIFHIPPAEMPRPATQNPWHFLAPESQPYDVPLLQDWTFPEDPWAQP